MELKHSRLQKKDYSVTDYLSLYSRIEILIYFFYKSYLLIIIYSYPT